MNDPELTMELLKTLITPSGLGSLAVDTPDDDEARRFDDGAPRLDVSPSVAAAGAPVRTAGDGKVSDTRPAA